MADPLQYMLDAMDDALLGLDAHARLTAFNQAGRELFGINDDALLLPLSQIVRVPELMELWNQMGQGQPAMVEFDLLDRSRRRFFARATRTHNGGAILVVQDVTEMRRSEQARREGIAHRVYELRTPVSIIRANAETLLAGALDRPQAARRLLEATVRHADRLSGLVGELIRHGTGQ